MNKLEEYRDKTGELKVDETTLYGGKKANIGSSARSYWENQFLGFQQGFDAAIALDLPVKFAEWMTERIFHHDILMDDQVWRHGNIWTRLPVSKDAWVTPIELYQYWIDNIYKPE